MRSLAPKLVVHLSTLTLLLAPLAVAAQRTDAERRAALEAFVAERRAAAEAERAYTEVRAALFGLPLHLTLADGTVISLQRFDLLGKPLYYLTNNLNAARTVSTDDVWAGGGAGLSLNGAGQLLGLWDGGNVRQTHQELTGRVTNLDGAANSSHSTHVAGTMIATGVDVNAHGMANAATIRGHDFNNDEIEMAADQLIPTPPRVSNHSYGFISGWRYGDFGCTGLPGNQWYWFGDVVVSTQEDAIFGLYEDNSAAWDQIAHDSPDYLIVKSSGNDRGEGPATQPVPHCHLDNGVFIAGMDTHPLDGAAGGGYDTIGGGAGSAKNLLTIGAVYDIPGGYSGPGSVVASNFHGIGPTDDGRIKPDLVANGVSLYSSIATSNTAYDNYSGTSMSTPNTSGSIALLRHHAANLGAACTAATYKALAIHTADEAGANDGPDYVFGWGLLNTRSAAALLTQQDRYGVHVYELSYDGAAIVVDVFASGSAPLRATIAWTDPPGPPQDGSVLDPPTLMLVNDLDMQIAGPGMTLFSPWVLDPNNPATAATTGDNDRDSVEQVVVASPSAGGLYTVTIAHEGPLTMSPQALSLIVSGNTREPIFADGFESGTTAAWSNAVP